MWRADILLHHSTFGNEGQAGSQFHEDKREKKGHAILLIHSVHRSKAIQRDIASTISNSAHISSF